MLGKIMGLASLGSSLANVRLLQRFLSGVASVIALTVVSAILVGLLLASAFVGMFFALEHFGLEPLVAGLLVIAMVLLVVGGCVGLALAKIRELRDLPNNSLNFEVPSIAKFTSAVEAFIDGFVQHKHLYQQDRENHYRDNFTTRSYQKRNRF
jgi:predicted PurR-regulated permease PerM